MRLSYSLGRSEYASGVEAVLSSIAATDFHRSWERRRNLIAIAYYTSFGVAVLVAIQLFPTASVQLLLLAGAVLSLQEIASWAHCRIARMGLGATFDPRRHSNVEAIFGRDDVSYAGAEHRQTWRWTLLRQLHDLQNLYVLEFVGFDILVVPKRAFSTPSEEELWVDEVKKRIPAPPDHA